MSENKKIKINMSSQGAKMFISGFVLFACAVAFTPAAGVVRTLPLFLAGGALSFVIGVSQKTISAFCALMTLCTYLASGRGVAESLLYAVVSCLLAAAGAYAVRFFRAAKKTNKDDVRKKCVLSAVLSLALSVVLSLVLCGNIVSFIVNDAKNTQYIVNNYGKEADKRYTSYEAFAGEYRTYVSFADDGAVYGDADECYVNAAAKRFNDDVRNYREDKILYETEVKLASVVAGATWGFNITASDIDFADGEILPADARADAFADRARYVISFDSIVTQKDMFSSICEDTVSAIKASGFDFEKIVMCAGGADRVLFSLTVTPETEWEDVAKLVADFDESHVADVGVTEMTILDYWENK